MRPRALFPVAWLAFASACVGAMDDPSSVHDLRVLGVSLDPPELMADTCNLTDPSQVTPDELKTWSSPVTYTALIAGPFGDGGVVAYELFACGDPNDRTCSNTDQRMNLGGGIITDGGEVVIPVVPGTANVDGGFILYDVAVNDPYHGLGGLRMPLVLHVSAGTEEIYAQKLMVFSCKLFPDMTAAVNPELSGFKFAENEWPADGGSDGGFPMTAQGAGTFHVQADDISDRQKSYSVVDFNLQEVHLTESWKIDYYATLGKFAPNETGGTDLAGNQDPHTTQWTAPSGAPDQMVTFWFVVRNGRGGESWTQRFLHYIP